MLDDRPAGGEVAAEHGHSSSRVDGVAPGPHDRLARNAVADLDVLAEGPSRYGGRVEAELRAQLAEHRVQTARVVQVLHVVVSGGLEVHEHRHAAADRVELVEVDLDPEPARDRGDVHEPVRRAADGLEGDERVVERVRGHDPPRAEVLGRDLDRAPAGALGEALPVRVHGGDGGAARQHHAERLRHAGHGARGPHHHAGPGGGGEPVVHVLDLGVVELPGAVHAPEAAAVGARPEPLAPVVPGHHRAGGKDEGGHLRARGGHELGGNGLVATADEDDRVHRLGPHHLLGVHRHQVAEEHARRVRERLVEGDGGEGHRQSPGEHHPPLHRFHEPGDVRVAGVVVAAGVRDSDDRKRERVVGEAHRLDERLAQEQGEAFVPVPGEALAHPARGRAVRHRLPPAACLPPVCPNPGAARRHSLGQAHSCSLRSWCKFPL